MDKFPDEQSSDDKSLSVNDKLISIIGYSFSILSLVIFTYIFIFNNSEKLKEQAIYWFYSSFIAALIPNIKLFKFKDVEVQFKENLKAINKKLDNIEIKQNVALSLRTVFEDESLLSDEEKSKRDVAFDRYAEHLKTLPPPERLEKQKYFTLLHLNQRDLGIYDLKTMLKEIDFYEGEINSRFDRELVNSLLEFQRKAPSPPMDGTCGPKTLSKIYEFLNKKDKK